MNLVRMFVLADEGLNDWAAHEVIEAFSGDHSSWLYIAGDGASRGAVDERLVLERRAKDFLEHAEVTFNKEGVRVERVENCDSGLFGVFLRPAI